MTYVWLKDRMVNIFMILVMAFWPTGQKINNMKPLWYIFPPGFYCYLTEICLVQVIRTYGVRIIRAGSQVSPEFLE